MNRLSLGEFMIAIAILGVLAATTVPALVQSTHPTASAMLNLRRVMENGLGPRPVAAITP